MLELSGILFDLVVGAGIAYLMQTLMEQSVSILV